MDSLPAVFIDSNYHFNGSTYSPLDTNFDPAFDITYKLILVHFDTEFKSLSSIDSKIFTPVAFRSRIFQQYLDDFKKLHEPLLLNRSLVVQQMYILHQTAKNLQRYNDEILHLPYNEFRAKFYFPNIIYLLIRFLPAARAFLQKVIRNVYSSIQKKSSGIINLHENSIYLDRDVIKSDVLYNFLGNTIKKINPFEIRNMWAFYKRVFVNIFYYYFKSEQKVHSSWSTFWILDEALSSLAQIPTREIIYRDVLTNLQINDYRNTSPTLKQIHYNYNVFKNVIVNNEFQSIYFTAEDTKDKHTNPNNHYKLLSLYNEIESDECEVLEEIRKLPTIYRLLKSVRIVSKRKILHSPHINIHVIKSAVLEELLHPFKNLISDSYIHQILDTISTNFAESILNGEYVNLLTLTPIKIDQATFIPQIRKFVQLCLLNGTKK